MSGQNPLKTDRWGVDNGYWDIDGNWKETSDETRRAILAAMRSDEPVKAAPEPLVIRLGDSVPVSDAIELRLEDGSTLPINAKPPSDVPLGYHELTLRDGRRQTLIVAPAACHLPPGMKIWGWSLQLYELRSQTSWGIGDFADLRKLADWSSRELGARMILVNPLDANLPTTPQQSSPYFPGSRLYRNLLYLAIDEVPGAEHIGPLAEQAKKLNAERHIDRDAVFRLKMKALEELWKLFPGNDKFDAYCNQEGDLLVQFARFCVLAEQHGRNWRAWPEAFRRPGSTLDTEHRDRVRFHQWIQWLLDRQASRAGALLAVMQDLPVGFDPDGFDAWLWQDLLAWGVGIGAPPDAYSANGQDWGLPPFIPHRLKAANYLPFRQTVRAALRHAGGLRIDHVMGLFRLFWAPSNGGPKAGAYVRYPADHLLAILSLESQRAKAFVVGEDLGTVEDGVREKLGENNVLSYRVMWFEKDHPRSYPERSLAALNTHDLPTLAGVWTGADLKLQKEAGIKPNRRGLDEMRQHIQEVTALPKDAPLPDVIRKAHEALAEAPSVVITASLEDALGVEERPNLPATSGERPNWSLALPLTLEQIEEHPQPRELAEIFGQRR